MAVLDNCNQVVLVNFHYQPEYLKKKVSWKVWRDVYLVGFNKVADVVS